MSCTHENRVNLRATATAIGAGSENGQDYWQASASIVANARAKSGSQLHIGQACSGHGEAEVIGAEGGGLYHLHGDKYTTGTATMAGDVEVLAGTNSLYAGTATGKATTEAIAGVIWFGCPECDADRAVAMAQGIPKLDPWADLYAYAEMWGDWRLLGLSSVLGEAQIDNGTGNVNWSLEGEMVGIAEMTGGDTASAGALVATANVDESFASLYYSNGLLKLKGVAGIMQNLLPQYMQEGEIIKRILEAFGAEIERAIYARDGFPAQFSGVDGLVQQFFVVSATWGLDIWESMLGLPVRTGDTDYLSRRGDILSKLAARKNESEYWFKRRLELLITTPENPNPFVIINPGEPAVEPYTIELETNALLGEIPPANAMTVAVHGSPGVLVGEYTYRATFVFQTGETDEGLSESPSMTALNNRIIIGQIPISSGAALARKIYRKNGPGNPWYHIATIEDNTSTVFVDNIADNLVTGNDIISPWNTATTVLGLKFLDYVDKTKPAHIHVNVRSERFRASINAAGDPV